MCLKQGPGAPTPHCVCGGLLLGGGGHYKLGGNGHQVGSLVTTETREGMLLTTPLIRTINSWDMGQVHRKVSRVSRV